MDIPTTVQQDRIHEGLLNVFMFGADGKAFLSVGKGEKQIFLALTAPELDVFIDMLERAKVSMWQAHEGDESKQP